MINMVKPGRAILIQSITEYLAVITPYLQQAMYSATQNTISHPLGVSLLDAIKWIIVEEIELIYNLYARQHTHNHQVFSTIHNRLQAIVPIPLSTLTAAHIKAPQIYDDNNIVSIEITEHDITIEYYKSPL